MKWKLAEIASFAEIIAAIGVIISLIFVGIADTEMATSKRRAATISGHRKLRIFHGCDIPESRRDLAQSRTTGAPLDDEDRDTKRP